MYVYRELNSPLSLYTRDNKLSFLRDHSSISGVSTLRKISVLNTRRRDPATRSQKYPAEELRVEGNGGFSCAFSQKYFENLLEKLQRLFSLSVPMYAAMPRGRVCLDTCHVLE